MSALRITPVLSALLWMACAGTTPSSATTPSHTPLDDAERAARLAPDLIAQAQLASQDAARAEGSTREDLERAADLWRAAALAEADRVELLRKRRAHEAEHEAAELQRAELDKKRSAVEGEIRRAEAARIAGAEATRMLELAASDELSRPGKARVQEDARAEVARWLVGRARLLLATASALGLTPAQAAPAEAAVADALAQEKRARSANAQLESARNALAVVERALGLARAAHAAPTNEERDSLIEMAAERKLVPARDPRGIVFDVSSALAPGTSKLTREGRMTLAHLAAIARAYPHGVIRIEALAPASAPAAVRKARTARAQALAQAISGATSDAASLNAANSTAATSHGVTSKERVQLAENPLPDGSRAFVVFVAYALANTLGAPGGSP